MSIPLLNQAPRIHPQQRLNVSERVGDVIRETKGMGLQHGRLILKTPADRTSAEYLLYFDALVEAGCVIVSINEHPAMEPGQDMPWIQAHILFRLPRETVS